MTGVSVGESRIEGLGVFAARPFSEGDVVLVIDTSRVVDEARPLRPERGEHEDHCTYLQDGRVVLLGAPERHLNHSCDPNAYLRTVGDELRVMARRSIEVDEEITLDYLINAHGGSRWRCGCGTASCRGLLEASFFDLPLELQNEYVELLEPWFVEEHVECVDRLKERMERQTPGVAMDDDGQVTEHRMVAFLRGINLGGRRPKMEELRGHFEAMDLARVATYLSSGNVVFDAAGDPAGLEPRVEAQLEARLGYDVDTFIRLLPELAPLLALDGLAAAEADGFKPHVIFLKEEVDDAAERSLAALESPDDVFRPLGREVVWLRRGGLSDSPISHSDLERALGGRSNTMRTMNTVRRIVAKFGEE